MRLTLSPTGTIERVNGQPCRRWEGATEDGTPVHAWIAMVSPQTKDEAVNAKFHQELSELQVRRELVSFDYRMIAD